MNFNQYAREYIYWAYSYYVLDTPIVTDNMFDTAAQILANNYNKLDDEIKQYLSLDALLSGTYLGEYPEWVGNGVMKKR